jgi:hypothetical protein
MDEKFFIGIDPGASGAIAMIREDGRFVCVHDFPGDEASLWQLLREEFIQPITLAVLEKVASMPKQGVSSTFKFGTNFGIWKMAMAAMGWRREEITPVRWRKILDSSVPLHPSKEDLRQYSMRRWPDAMTWLSRKKDDGRAEALLIAEYARRKIRGTIV